MSSPEKRENIARYFHPVLFLLLPFVSLYASNPGQISFFDMARAGVIFVVLAVFLSGFFYWIARHNLARTTLCLSLFLFLLTSFDKADGLLKRFEDVIGWASKNILHQSVSESLFGSEREYWVLATWLTITISLLLVCVRTKRDVIPIAWIVGTVLVLMPLSQIVSTETSRFRAELTARNVTVAGTKSKVEAPDLYVIILDTYARHDILESMYGLNNEPFLKELEARGFLVARQSRANYIQSVLCIGAALNLDYLKPNPDGGSWAEISPIINHNQIAAILREKGFRFFSIPTGFAPVATPSADKVFSDKNHAVSWTTISLTSFEDILLGRTPLRVIPRKDEVSIDVHRKRILSAFDHLGTVATLPYRKFVFAHILSPHPPFVFCSDGEACSPTGQNKFQMEDGNDFPQSHAVYKRGYKEQVQFVNQRTLSSLDQIQANSSRPYVIVLMSDHGARSGADWESRKNTDIHEAFSNFFAVYSPHDRTNGQIAPALSQRMDKVITPITGLRAVLNQYFGTNFSDIPDRSFYSTVTKPLVFEEVTKDLDYIQMQYKTVKHDTNIKLKPMNN